jgi:elongation factor Ts
MEITAQAVKELRDRTGAGVMDCRKALTEADGDQARAEAILREKGMRGPKDPTRETKQGVIATYRHPGDQLAAMVELNCETDFVARTEDFRNLATEVALHVAAANPLYLEKAAIPEEALQAQRAAFEEQLLATGQSAEQRTGQIDARLEAWVGDVALLEQPYVRDAKLTVRQLILGVAAKTGENIRVGRFARFKIGE